MNKPGLTMVSAVALACGAAACGSGGETGSTGGAGATGGSSSETSSTARGDVVVVRYADDFVVGFEYQPDAEELLDALRERLRGFALELHPDKTRLIAFGRYANASRKAQDSKGAAETFSFLGFTQVGWIICG